MLDSTAIISALKMSKKAQLALKKAAKKKKGKKIYFKVSKLKKAKSGKSWFCVASYKRVEGGKKKTHTTMVRLPVTGKTPVVKVSQGKLKVTRWLPKPFSAIKISYFWGDSAGKKAALDDAKKLMKKHAKAKGVKPLSFSVKGQLKMPAEKVKKISKSLKSFAKKTKKQTSAKQLSWSEFSKSKGITPSSPKYEKHAAKFLYWSDKAAKATQPSWKAFFAKNAAKYKAGYLQSLKKKSKSKSPSAGKPKKTVVPLKSPATKGPAFVPPPLTEAAIVLEHQSEPGVGHHQNVVFTEVPQKAGSEKFKALSSTLVAHARSQSADVEESKSLAWRTSLSTDEKAAIKDYTKNGYSKINAALRKGVTPTGGMKKTIDDLKAACSRAKLPSKIVVFRGVVLPELRALAESGDAVGSTVVAEQFYSTSLTDKKAFITSVSPHAVLLRIGCPAGSGVGC